MTDNETIGNVYIEEQIITLTMVITFCSKDEQQ